MKNNHKEISKFLSYILRHCPEYINLKLDPEGWGSAQEIIEKSQPQINLTLSLIREVVRESDKQRFILSEDELFIRANQGHSIKVNLNLSPQKPPDKLYHGTATRFLESIQQEGLQARERQYVHLSDDIETAKKVGQRHGKAIVLEIDSERMYEQGYDFLLSENQVWLTQHIPPHFLIFK